MPFVRATSQSDVELCEKVYGEGSMAWEAVGGGSK